MSNLVKYGKYFISAGIAIGGAVWLQRPKDVRIKGEDIADLYGAVQDCYVVPYLVGEALPDWQAANDGNTTTVGAAISYYDIKTIGMRARDLWTRNGNILWTTNMFAGDTVEPSKMLGGFSFTNTNLAVVDDLNPNGLMVTNRYYTYSTNTYADNLITTATRLFTPAMKFEPWIMGSQYGWMVPITSTNLPVSGYVFSGASAGTFQSLTNYTSWPFEWSFVYPWEQWSYPTKSRVTVLPSVYTNVVFTNLLWIGTNSLSLTVSPSNGVQAGVAVASMMDVAGNLSPTFVYIKTPPNNDYLYLSPYTYAPTVPFPYNYVYIRVLKGANSRNATIDGSVVYGESRLNISPAGQGYYFTDFQFTTHYPSDGYSVIKFTSSYAGQNPVYAFIAWTNNPSALSNAYFTIANRCYVDTPVIATATTNAVTKTFKATDDLRISTNKLNGLAQIITNMNRTVYFGGIGTLIATNRVCKRTDTFWNGQANIYYITEWMSGNTEQDPQYYDFGDPAQYIPTYIATAGTDTFTNTNWSVREIYSERLQYVAYKQGQRYSFAPDPGGGWNGYSNIEGQSYEKLEYSYTGVTPVYPSMFAVTNGYVKKVTVYALYEVRTAWQPSYLAGQYYYMGDNFSHDVGGNYWTTYNTGLSISGKTLSTPTEALPDTRVKYLHRDYATAIKNRAVYCKIAEVSNPTSQIFFDIDRATVTAMNFASQHAYSFSTEEDGVDDNWEERFTWDYSGGAEVNTVQFMVVVDWKFQHLGRGFTP